MNVFDRLRAYYRFKDSFPFGRYALPWFRNKVKRKLSEIPTAEIVRIERDFLIPVNSGDAETGRVQSRGCIDISMEWVVSRYVKSGSVAVDVGANLGYISLLMADKVGEDGVVYAVEPNDLLYNYMTELFHLNQVGNVNVVKSACSDHDGEALFSLDGSDHTMSKLSSVGGKTVPLKTVETILKDNRKRVSFLKIDVEGHEASVLGGAKNILRQDRPVVVFETGLHSQVEIDRLKGIFNETNYEVVGVISDWGVVRQPLSVKMTDKSHCNVLVLPR